MKQLPAGSLHREKFSLNKNEKSGIHVEKAILYVKGSVDVEKFTLHALQTHRKNAFFSHINVCLVRARDHTASFF